ncbi:MAG TPA: cell envelope integrity EipB family protein [Pseudolabrys sp.]|jgi:hypothetical protein|nr:cell envelope integrity EipB family protein [Pseudolabrys sp.]
MTQLAAGKWLLSTFFACIVVGAAMAATRPASRQASDDVFLAPHRAVYDLTLIRSRGTRGIDGMTGRIVYDFSGNACAGYTLDFRQVSDMESGEGKSAISDLRSRTWEGGKADKFRFNSENRINDQRASVVDGRAVRTDNALRVSLSKPSPKSIDMPARAVFPTEHMRRVIAAARAGTQILEFPVYDGSDNGLKLYDTLTVIGKEIPPGAKPPHDAAATVPALAGLARWPVTISYFERESEAEQQTHEQTPVYAISFELYGNGISRALKLYYKDFTLSGTMTALTLNKPQPCE